MNTSKKTNSKHGTGFTRRHFMKGAASAAAFMIVPRHVLGNGVTAPSDKLNVAGIGIGGMGKSNIKNLSDENIVALCDVDDNYAAEVYKLYPNARTYRDFRIMLEKQKDIDGVVIATPDHTHAVIAMTAMRMGKHVYCQKPLTRLVSEARRLTEAAREYKVATQMGNQGHSGEGVRLICEWIWNGAIGTVREVEAWTNRPVWPQGIDRPTDILPVPSTLDWDLWLGPAPDRPYNPIYHPFSWRAWWDFGCGALGDMACHVLDPVFTSLKLKYPTSVEASISTFVSPKKMWVKVDNKETFPQASIIRYTFPARRDMPPVKVTWYDGGLMPERPEELEPDLPMGNGSSGVLFIGEKGKLMCNEYGDNPRLIPKAAMDAYKQPPKTIPRITGSHEQDWARACKGGEPACSNFDYSGPLTEMVVMGNLAIRYPQKKLEWDGENMQVTNFPEANDYVQTHYREGWTL